MQLVKTKVLGRLAKQSIMPPSFQLQSSPGPVPLPMHARRAVRRLTPTGQASVALSRKDQLLASVFTDKNVLRSELKRQCELAGKPRCHHIEVSTRAACLAPFLTTRHWHVAQHSANCTH